MIIHKLIIFKTESNKQIIINYTYEYTHGVKTSVTYINI